MRRMLMWGALPLAVAGFLALAGESFEDNVARSLLSTVAVGGGGGNLAQDNSGFMLGGGSGSVVSAEGHVVTNCHVMGWGRQRHAFIRLDSGEIVPARLLFSNCKVDIAILRMLPEDEDRVFEHVTFGDSDDVNRAERVYAIGNPGDVSNLTLRNLYKDILLKNTVTSGVIRDRVLAPQVVARMHGSVAIGGTSAVVDYGMELSETFETDATINSGNSGGPLFDAYGLQIGVNFAGTSMFEGQNMAIAGNDAKKTLDDVIEHGRVVYAWLGIYAFIDRRHTEYSDEFSIQGNSPIYGMDGFRGRAFYDRVDLYIKEAREMVTAPFEVLDIYPASPVALARLRRGDLIHDIGVDADGDGTIAEEEMVGIGDAFDLLRVVRSLKKGDEVLLKVERDGAFYHPRITLGEQPPAGTFAGGTI
ncbi:serine protease [bacterium]|nr:serine protease [bacterium]